MAAGTMKIDLSNGEQINVYIATTEVVGATVRCSKNGTATASSPTTFSVGGQCLIKDITGDTNNVSGEMEVVSNGVRTGKKIPQDQRWLGTQAGRDRIIPQIGFLPGRLYSFVQTVAHT